ncbi:hypothetical protein SAMN04487897_108160 [Paenibacillus sp. yr247]|uniref:hypothetical protein n=1 Tax=Paenibacillus sp. yr247 TaxID=1761880 RepID=UPI00089131FB|nr:hypothetical protein [Paenibacillus sp. yr247]SDO11880.1 hypothetical protein SAMN04487897_108160 [Paenibacillus sp. yr247]
MGTRLLSEQLVRNRFPHLNYIRIHTPEKHKATIYAWNGDLHLPEKDAHSLQKYASGYLYPYVCFQVKAYNLVQADKVPQLQEVPEAIIQTAKRRNLNQFGIIEAINRLFPCGRLTFNRYHAAESIIHFDFHATRLLHDREKEGMYNYLYEMIPLGSYCEVTFY